jgi:hypothetical protein
MGTTTTTRPPSQRERLATHLRQWGGIDQPAAGREGIGQLRTRVLELRRAGWDIHLCPNPECSGHYVLMQAPGEPARAPLLGL